MRRRAGWAARFPRTWGALAGCAIALAMPAPTAAQDSSVLERVERLSQELDAAYRLRVPPDQPMFERLLLDYRLSARFGFLAVDDEFGETSMLRQSEGQLQLLAQLDGAHTFYGRLRFLYNDFNSGDSFDDRGDDLEEPIGDRYWYQFDYRRAHFASAGTRAANNVNVKVGRDYVQWGAGLALNNVLYHALLDVELGDWGLRGLAGLTPSSETIDFDASRPGYDTSTRRRLFGALLEHRGFAQHRPFVSYLVQRDRNHKDFAVIDTPFTAVPTSFKYDSEYLAFGSRGSLSPQWAYGVELVRQTGEGLSSPIDPASGSVITQTTEDVDAWAGMLTLNYLFRDDHDSRLTFEMLGATGDTDRFEANDTFGGNTFDTDDEAFNGLGYVNTGLALAPEITNLLMLRIGYSTSPRQRYARNDWLRVGIDGFLFAKTDQSAPISVHTDNESFVGGEIDVYADWQLASDVLANVRYGVFLPGEAMPRGEDSARHFFYAGLTIEF